MREKGYLNLKTTSNEGRVRKAIEICKKNLKRVLRNNAAEIISVGSAAIKDIKMRPSVDFLVSATSEKELSICADLLKTTGYTQIQTSSDLYPLFFIGSAPCRLSCTVRLVLANSKAYWTAVNFRDYLNINSSRKSEYEQIKLSALQKHPGDSAGYNEAKTVFLDRIGGEVRDWKIFTSSFTVSEIKRLNPEKTDNPINECIITDAKLTGLLPDKAFLLGNHDDVSDYKCKVIAVLTKKTDNGNTKELWVLGQSGVQYFKPQIQAAVESAGETDYRYICYYEKSCGAVVYFVKNGEPLYLLIKNRSLNMGFPKGHVEAGEDEYQTAVREIFEETNLHVTLDKNFRQQYFYAINFFRKKHAVYFIARGTTGKIAIPKNEILSYSVVGIKEALKLLSYPNEKLLLKEAHAHIIKQIEEERKRG